MTSETSIGRWAGLAYLVVVVSGLFSLLYVPSQINLPNDIETTLDSIRRHEDLYRAGLAAFLIKQVAFLMLAALLFRLLAPRHAGLAATMVGLVAVSVPIALVSLVNKIDVLTLLTHPPHMQATGMDQLLIHAQIRLDAYRNGLLVTNLFWGLWLLPLGYLGFQTRLLPRVLGALLVLGGLGYVAHVFATLLLRSYAATGAAEVLLMPAAIGEIGTCLWLLAMGGRPAARPASPLTSHL